MCFDANKQYLGAGDVLKDVRINKIFFKKNKTENVHCSVSFQYPLKLEKGEYLIRMNIRHEKVDQLERLLKENGGLGLSIQIEHKMNCLPSSDFYHSLDHLITQKKKLTASTIKLPFGQQIQLYFTALPEEKFVHFLFSKNNKRDFLR